MKIYKRKSPLINKYKNAVLISVLVITSIHVLSLIPFIIFKHNQDFIEKNWYYIIVILLSIIVLYLISFTLVRSYSKAVKKLKIDSRETEYKNLALVHMFNELKTTKEKLNIFSETLERTVLEKTESIRNLLDNAGQGFLTFGTDLAVDENYSLECRKIFNCDIKGKNISQLIFPGDEEQQQLLQSVISKVLTEDDIAKREAYLSLLPEETTINNRQIHILYKIITINSFDPTEAVMLILTDITENKKLHAQMEEDRHMFEMTVNVITNFSDFIDCVQDYENFCTSRVSEIVNTSYSIEDIIVKLYRAIHTFKGNFSQFGLRNISASLHEFETDLSSMMDNKNNVSLEDLEKFLSKYKMADWINDDLCILKDILGDSFFKNTERVEVDKQELLDIETKMMALMSPIDYNLLIPKVRKLRYKPFKELLSAYTSYLVNLSDRFCKQINPLVIEGGEFYVDPKKYSPLVKSLGHIFRDIMEYGIECWDERKKAGKSEYGTIKCIANIAQDKLNLTITDDGSGLDVELIKKTAVEKGFYTEAEIKNKNEAELISLIFYDGFSTNCRVSDLSGRGIGLSAVKDEVDKLGGSIEATTSIGLGTKFAISVPYSSITDLPQISETELLNALVDTTKRFFEGRLRFVDEDGEDKVKKVDTIYLSEITVLIRTKGAINGIFLFTADKNLISSILSYFLLDSAKQKEEEISNEDLLAECTNMIMGNFLKFLPYFEDYITLGTPITLEAQYAKVQHSVGGIWIAPLLSDKGKMDIIFLNSI